MKPLIDAKARINSQDWFHSIEIADGLVTPGRTPLPSLQNMMTSIQFPTSFEGLSVLDIGAWDGFFSFEAEKRGAQRVVAYDMHPPDHYGFALAKELLNSKVEYVQGSVYDLSPEICGTFDIVLFFGVFYHLRYPLLALDRIWQVTKQFILMETHCLDQRVILEGGQTVPLAHIDQRLNETALYQFYRRDELQSGDFSNWFAPNRQAVADALGSAGFEPEFLASWHDRIAFKGTKRPGIPEYQQQTYEGLTWTRHQDGSQSLHLPPRQPQAATADDNLSGHSGESGLPLKHPVHAFQQTATATQHRAGAQPSGQSMPSEQPTLAAIKAQLQAAQKTLQRVEQTRTYRLLRRLGFWKFIETSQ